MTVHTHTGLAGLILEKVSTEQLVLWAESNRGSFVLCALVPHLQGHSNKDHLKLAILLKDTLTTLMEDEVACTALKGQQALAKELDKYFSVPGKS